MRKDAVEFRIFLGVLRRHLRHVVSQRQQARAELAKVKLESGVSKSISSSHSSFTNILVAVLVEEVERVAVLLQLLLCQPLEVARQNLHE